MSAQINLYHPRYLKQREWLGLGPVAVAGALVYALLAVAGSLAWRGAAVQQEKAAVAANEVKALRARLETESKAVAARKPDARLQAEVETAERLLKRREDIVGQLEGGAIGSTEGFSGYFRALARHTPDGLWLTAFSITGGQVEIRGSTFQSSAVPDFIRRLGGEPSFQGNSFAALTMERPAPAPVQQPAGGAAATGAGAVAPGLTSAALRPIDFVLLPKPAENQAVGQ